jgi:hypothetical protein
VILDLVSGPSARSSKHPSRFEMGRDHLTSETAEISLEIVGRDQVGTTLLQSYVRVRYVHRCMYRRNYRIDVPHLELLANKGVEIEMSSQREIKNHL